jgi:hypothetical protein
MTRIGRKGLEDLKALRGITLVTGYYGMAQVITY